MICGPLLAKDLASIGRDWNTPRRHYGHLPAILFGVVYFIFGVISLYAAIVARSAQRLTLLSFAIWVAVRRVRVLRRSLCIARHLHPRSGRRGKRLDPF